MLEASLYTTKTENIKNVIDKRGLVHSIKNKNKRNTEHEINNYGLIIDNYKVTRH